MIMYNLKEVMSFMKITENLKVSEACLNDIIDIVEEYINEVSKDYLNDKREKANIKVTKAIIRHGKTMSPENPKGNPHLMKIRQNSIDRLKKYDEKCKEYLEKKEKKDDK